MRREQERRRSRKCVAVCSLLSSPSHVSRVQSQLCHVSTTRVSNVPSHLSSSVDVFRTAIMLSQSYIGLILFCLFASCGLIGFCMVRWQRRQQEERERNLRFVNLELSQLSS
jgi:hypothetical protein